MMQFKDYTEQVIDVMEKNLAKGAILIAAKAEKYAKEDCPVDTGTLRDSIIEDIQDHSIYIGTNVSYAKYVEFDDHKNHPHGKAHFLRDAITTHPKEYKEILKKALKGE